MLEKKSSIISHSSSANLGFTLIELMVVVTIMALLAGVLSLNIAGQRNARNIALAENELVAHIREIQSYTLSSRQLVSGDIPQYYILKFDFNNPTQYTLQALYNVSSTPQVQDVETIYLPQNIQISIANITQRPAVPSSQVISGVGCALVAFAVPFGKTFFNNGCSPTPLTSNPYTVASNSDYQKIVNYVSNVSCFSDPSACTITSNAVMSITISSADGSLARTVTINGITGAVTFN